MDKHGFKSIAEFKGASLPYFTTHTDLVHKQRAAIDAKKAADKVSGWQPSIGAGSSTAYGQPSTAIFRIVRPQ
jgi:hypothetical protein